MNAILLTFFQKLYSLISFISGVVSVLFILILFRKKIIRKFFHNKEITGDKASALDTKTQQKMEILFNEKLNIFKKLSLLSYSSALDKSTIKKVNEIVSREYTDYFNWDELSSLLDESFNNYTTKLNQIFPSLSENEIHLCYLLKANYRTGDIAFIMEISPDTVRVRKTNFRKKTGILNGGDIIKFLDQKIEEFDKENPDYE